MAGESEESSIPTDILGKSASLCQEDHEPLRYSRVVRFPPGPFSRATPHGPTLQKPLWNAIKTTHRHNGRVAHFLASVHWTPRKVVPVLSMNYSPTPIWNWNQAEFRRPECAIGFGVKLESGSTRIGELSWPIKSGETGWAQSKSWTERQGSMVAAKSFCYERFYIKNFSASSCISPFPARGCCRLERVDDDRARVPRAVVH